MIRTTLLGCALAVTVMSTAALAQGPIDQRTYFTFSAPFELPGGKTLPAGKCTFRILDSASSRHVVQILNERGTEVHTTLLAIPAQRQDPPSEPEIRFMETAANMPPAIRTWWYPGRTIGHEFIYPKDHARRLAAANPSVLTVAGSASSTEEMRTADLTRVDAAGQETAVASEAAATRTARVERPAPMPERAPATRVDTADERRTELPRTATTLPLVGLIGLRSLGAAAGLHRLRRS